MATKTAARSKSEGKRKAARGKAGARGRAAGPALPSVADHPRAAVQVTRVKAWAGLAGFALVAFLSMQAGVPTADALLRALVAGVAAYLVAWACAVAVWRHLVIAELRAVRRARADAVARLAAQAAERGSGT